MKDGFITVAAATPAMQVADTPYNTQLIIETAHAAARQGAKLLVTPELGITGYTCGDLFLQQRLADTALVALESICIATARLDMLIVVGLPLQHQTKLYNCAAVIKEGRVLGIVPKTHLPNYGEYYELRQFTPAFEGVQNITKGFLRGVPFGCNLLFTCEDLPQFVLAVEICEDLWVPTPPSNRHTAAGATVVANLSASNELIGKQEYRRGLVAGQAARLVCGYVYAAAGRGESTTDMVFAGNNMVAENGTLLAEGQLFKDKLILAQLDVQRLCHERQRLTTYPPVQRDGYVLVPFGMRTEETALTRQVSPTPFIPGNAKVLDERCETILAIQAAGLCKRLAHIGSKTAVVGLSGGLDSALALLVTARAFDTLGLARSGICAITMPAFGTTRRTRGNAEKLAAALGANFSEVNITDTVRSHFKDIGQSEDNHNVVYENAQARIRTLVLMDVANQKGGIVVGTGDLSELALGWATYNGDHMSMYAVNASVPKTLIRYIVAYQAANQPTLREVLQDILDTPVSPELLPAKDGNISQRTEDLVGPYELHDFFLYYMLRWGFAPRKIYRLATKAFNSKFSEGTILQWMGVFYRRFFTQQFKRSCMPDGPKVGSVSLSPRGDWRMPSDAVAAAWLQEVDALHTQSQMGPAQAYEDI